MRNNVYIKYSACSENHATFQSVHSKAWNSKNFQKIERLVNILVYGFYINAFIFGCIS